MMISIVLVLLTLALAHSSAETFQKGVSSEDGESTFQLALVTTIEGKSFYVDKTDNRTWMQARDFGNEMGMCLAFITSLTQLGALRIASLIGGRDAHTIEQFRWDDTDQPLSQSNITVWGTDMEYLTCIELQKRTNMGLTFSYRQCTNSNSGTLCEV